jgi:hypothetical protein
VYNRERYNARTPTTTGAPGWFSTFLGWLRTEFLSIQRAMPWAPHADTRDFVTVSEGADASSQFQAAANAVGVGTLFVAPRTYRFFSNITIAAGALLAIANGAFLQPQSGVTITILGPISAGAWQWMDWSAGGKFSFTGNRALGELDSTWFGVIGNGVADDSVPLNLIARYAPEYTRVRFNSGLVIGLANQVIVYNRAGVEWVSERNPFPNGVAPAAMFKWNGAAGGGAGYNGIGIGAMILIDQCPNFTFKGFCGFTNGSANANVGLDLDGDNTTDAGYAVSISAGSDILTIASGTKRFIPHMEGVATIAVVGAGPSGGELDATIKRYISPTQVQLSALASTPVSGALANIFGAYRFGTENVIEYCEFLQQGGAGNGGLGGNASLRHVRIAEVVQNNQEYHRIRYCHFQGGGGRFQTTATTTLGSPMVTLGQNVQYGVGSRVRIVGAGAAGAVVDSSVVVNSLVATAPSPPLSGTTLIVTAGDGATKFPATPFTAVVYGVSGTPEQVTVTAIAGDTLTITRSGARAIAIGDSVFVGFLNGTLPMNNGNFLRMGVNAGTAVAGARVLINEGLGVGVFIGGSFNAKKITIEHNQFVNCYAGVQMNNGSAQFFSNSYSFCEINKRLLSASEAILMEGENTEASGQDIFSQVTKPITNIGGRYHIGWAIPGGAYFDIQPLTLRPFVHIGNNYDDPAIPAGSTVFALNNCQLDARGSELATAMTMAQMGYVAAKMTGTSAVRSRGETGISDAPAQNFLIQSSTGLTTHLDGDRIEFWTPTGTQANGFHALVRSGNITTISAGITGEADSYNAGDVVGVRGLIGANSPFPGGIRGDGFRAVLPNYTAPNVNSHWGSIHGYTYTPPVIAGPGAVPVVYGYRAPALAQAGITQPWAFYNDSANDPNFFNGRTTFGTGTNKGAVVGAIAVGAGGAVNPNPAGAEVYRYSCAGNMTVNNPLNPAEGSAFTLEILNNTGGGIAITLGAAFMGTFPAPAAGKWRTQRYVYDNTLAKWKPTGAQSGDL